MALSHVPGTRTDPELVATRVAGPARAVLVAAVLAVAVTGCGRSDTSTAGASMESLAPIGQPIPAGRGAEYRLPAVSASVARRMPIGGLRCSNRHGRLYGIHLELYARRLVLPVPAGIGIAPPQRRSGAYVLGGACSYPIRTFEPTGVVVVDAGTRVPSLGALFAVWGRTLSSNSLAGFRGPLVAFLEGRRWRGQPDAIPLYRHAEIVVEINGDVPPHSAYRFPPRL